VASLTWLVLREYRPGAAGDEAVPAEVRVAPATSFSSLWAGATQVGLASISTDTLPEGVRITSRTDLDVPMPLVPRRLLSTSAALYDERLRLRSYTLTASGEAGQVTLAATAIGETQLSVVISGRGITTEDTVEVPVPVGVLLPDAVALALASRGKLRPGSVDTLQVLDPFGLNVSTRRIVVGVESTFVMPDSAVIDPATGAWVPDGRDTVAAIPVTWRQDGLPVLSWIDRRGTILSQQTPLGLTQRKSPFEIVNSGYVRRRPQNVQAAPLEVAAPVTEAVRPRPLSLGPVELRAAAATLTTPWQVVADGRLESRIGPPVEGRVVGPVPDSVAQGQPAAVASAPIVVTARRVVGSDSADPVVAVRKLAEWVATTIRPGQPALAGPERALSGRRGDSSDRAELLVLMVRALGIPARPVAGLLASGGRLRYRAWAEVWLEGWVPVDPTLGQLPADPGHYRLLTNATARPLTLAPMTGAVRPDFTTPTTAP